MSLKDNLIPIDMHDNVTSCLSAAGVWCVETRAGYQSFLLAAIVGGTVSIDQMKPTNVDEYIAGFPQDIQEKLEKIRATIREAAPDAEETINYRMPTFTLKGNLVHFAAFRKHIGFYPTPTGIEAFKKELSVYKGAKGSVQFPLDKPIPYDLIDRIVRFRVKESLELAAAKGKKR